MSQPVLFELMGGQWRPDSGSKAKILRFAHLPDGWNHGHGVPASLASVRYALALVNIADVLDISTEAFPGEGGEIAIAFYGRDRLFEVVVGDEGIEGAFVEGYNDEGRDAEPVEIETREDVYSWLLDLNEGPRWHSLDSSIHVTSTSTYHVLPTWHSSTPDPIQTPAK